jgi:hypothetical protein
MATPENAKKTRIQGMGWVPADEAQNLEVGDRVMWNGGITSTVTKIEEASRCFLLVHLKSTETDEERPPRRWKKTAIIARIPQEKTPEQAAAPSGWTDADTYHLDIIDADGTVYAHKDVDRQEAERLAAHETRTGTTRDDASGVITVHGLSTNSGPRTHVLTPQRPGVEWPCMVAEEPTEAAPARPAVEGVVIPAGHTLGIPAEYADNANVRDAYGALVAAGHIPAELSNRSDDGVDDTAFGTGFVIYARESAVLVGHLVDGVDMWNSLPDAERRKILRTYRDTLRAAGWETDGRVIGKRLHAWRTSPLPEGVTAAQTRGEAPQELPEGPVKVRFGLSDETRAQLRESGDRARAEHRAEFDERARQEAARHAPLPVGTRVRHAVQAWATSVQAPKGTAVVVGVGQTHADGSFEYKVIKGRDISRKIGPDNPMTEPGEWNSDRVRKVAPPRFEVQKISDHLWGVRDVDTELWAATGSQERCEEQAGGLNTGALELDAYGRIQRPQEPLQAMPEPPEGCRFEVFRERMRTVVRMYDGIQAAPVFEDWTGHEPDSNVVPMYAREMARVHNNAMKETAALLALDDATVYQVSTSAGDVETMTGRQARARLQSYREQVGPEKLHSRNTPRVTLEHSGARWLLTVHAYRESGNRDFRGNVRVMVVPQVTAEAGQALMRGTGGGWLLPAENLSTEAFGPWVRPVPNFPEQVVVHWVVCGSPVPQDSARWEEHMETYRGVLEAAGWVYKVTTADGGMVLQEPARIA